MKHVILNNGVTMPILGFGVYQIPAASECERCVTDALQVGYRSIDTAAAYMNEEAVGHAIAKSGIKREELFITTKLWIQDSGYDNAIKAFHTSLKKLNLGDLDLCLIHQPYGDVYGSWRAMEELYKEGLIRAIGVSNFMPDRIMDFILHQQIVPAVNQIETHPFLQQVETQKFLESQGVQIESWGPFAEGRNNLFTNSTLETIGQQHNKSVAQVVLRWLIQRDVVVIPKTISRERMAQNFDIFNFELTAAEMQTIASLDLGSSQFLDHQAPETIEMLSHLKIHD